MTEEIEEKEMYVYLDFQGKDTSMILSHDNVYFRMLNLSESKPILEIGEDVYEGTYDDAIGTNLFFEEIPDQPQTTSLYEKPTPLKLEFLLKQTKILKLNKIGTRQHIILNAPQTETVDINIKDDYRVLLEKYDKKELNIDDYIVVETPEESEELETAGNVEENACNNIKWNTLHSPQSNIPTNNRDQQTKPPVDLNYIKLRKLAEQPSKRKIREESTTTIITQPKFSIPKSDFIMWKNLMMQKVEHQSTTVDVRKDRIEDFVDIEESIKSGIIGASWESPRVFTKDEKSKLLSFENFVNVSPLMKLIMLQDYENTEKIAVEKMPPDELSQDEYTPRERYELIKSFREELQTYMVGRLREQYESLGETAEEIRLDATLTESDIASFSSNSSSDEEEGNISIKKMNSSSEIDESQLNLSNT